MAHRSRLVLARACIAVTTLAAVTACPAAAAGEGWATSQIRVVTKAGIFPGPVSGFRPQAPLTQAALAAAIRATDTIRTPPATPAPAAAAPQPVVLTATYGPGAVLAGVVPLRIDAPGRLLDHVDFAIDGTGVATATASPFELDLDTTDLADGLHHLAVNAAFAGGGRAIAVFDVTVANDGTTPTAPSVVSLAIAKSSLPALAPAPSPSPAPAPSAHGPLYRAASPTASVTVKQFDAALVTYLGLDAAAHEIQAALVAAGLEPPRNTGSEAVARMLGLRLNHPAPQDGLELLPGSPVTRAEAAFSFARVLDLDADALASVQEAAGTFALPELGDWQRRILATAVHYVGYPYVWGGTSPTEQTLFGVTSPGGFDCSGLVWRVYKLTSYPGEGDLATTIRGRTTYEMSGEVPKRERIGLAKIEPADVLFFGPGGPKSSPGTVDHAALYLGNGWFIQSSDEGVTLLPLSDGRTDSFAWARRPLREAGLLD